MDAGIARPRVKESADWLNIHSRTDYVGGAKIQLPREYLGGTYEHLQFRTGAASNENRVQQSSAIDHTEYKHYCG